MDLVKIGFIVKADGLKDANTQVDTLLAKVDSIGTKGKKSAAEFETGQKKVQRASKETEKVVVSASDKMIKRQEALTKYLPLMDKQTASLAASFSVASDEISKMDKFLGLVSKNKAIEQAKKDSESLAKAQQKQEQVYAKALEQSERARQSKLASEQKYYLKIQEEAAKAGKMQETLLAKEQAQQELNRQKRFNAEQQHYQKTVDLAQKQSQALKAEQQKITNNEEAARQKRFAAEQKYYQKQMSLQESANLKAAKNSIGFNISGGTVDKTSLPSLMALQKASDGARKANSGLVSSIKGIAAYALLSTAIYGVITGFTALTRSIIETSDEMQNLTQRLGIYLPANLKVNKVMEQLGEIAKENRVTLADSGKLFTQLLPPLQRIKGGVSQTIAVVDAFGKAMLVGGANTREAAAATIQFGQAMASGKLAGDEFRSLAEASPRLLQAIADGAGIAAQKLKEMSSAGKLTSGLVSSALLDQFIQLEYEAAKMGQTVGGAFNEGMVAYQLFVDRFNKQSGFTDGLVSSIRDIVSALEGFGEGFLANLKDGNSSLNAFINLFKTVWDLVGAVVIGFTDVVGWITKGGDKIGLWKTIFDSVRMSIITIVDVLAKIPFAIVNIGTHIADKILYPFQKFIELASKGLALAGFAEASKKLGDGLTGYRDKVTAIKSITGDVVTGFNLLSLGVKKTEDSTANVNSLVEKLKSQNSDLVLQEKEKKAMTDQQYIAEYSKFLLQKEGLAVSTENVTAIKKELDERFKITQEQSKQLKIQGELQAKRDEAEKKAKEAAEKAKKDAEAEQKRLEGIRKSYQEQIDYVHRLQGLLSSGEKFDVAKIAAEKDYFDAIQGTVVAREVAEAKRQLSITEYIINLDEEKQILTEIQQLQNRGATYDQARSLAQAKLTANEQGMLILQTKIVSELEAKRLSLTDQARTQANINNALANGLTIEEAITHAAFSRLQAVSKGLTKEQTALQDQINYQQHLLTQRQMEEQVLSDIQESIRQAAIYQEVLTKGSTRYAQALAKIKVENKGISDTAAKDKQTAEQRLALTQRLIQDQTTINSLLSAEGQIMKEIRDTFPNITKADEARLYQNKKIVDILQEQADLAEEARKNPLGDFSNVNFDAFGDFGNPFETALDGLNKYLFSISTLEEKLGYVKQQQIDLNTAKENYQGDKASEEYTKMISQIDTLAQTELNYLKQKKQGQVEAWSQGISLVKSLFKEESKGYKIVSNLEKAYQAGVIAFKLWEKKDQIQTLALEIGGYIKSTTAFITSAATKIAAQMGVNTAKGVEAVLNQGTGDPYTAFGRMAAMAAVVAGLGIAIAGVNGSDAKGGFASNNEGTGTVFGDTTAQSESIKKSIDLLAENSDVTLPLTSAMLKALQNIESNISGLANLLVRAGAGTSLSSGITEGFTQDKIGSFLEKAGNTVFAGLGDFLGLNKMIGGLLGGLFGSKVSLQGQGLFAGGQALTDILGSGFSLQEYVDINTKKKTLGVTTSNKNSTVYSQASEELSTQFTLIFKNFYDSILSTAPLLDKNLNEVTTKLNDFVVSIGKVNLQGLSGEQIQEKLNAVLGAEADKMAQAAIGGLEGFQKVGEGYFETVMRVASSIELADVYTARLNVSTVKYTDLLNKQGDVATEIIRQSVLLAEGNKNIANGFYDLVNSFNGTADEITDFVLTLRDLQDAIFATGKNGDYLTSAMFAGAGSLERLSSGLDAYFEMLSPAEQAAELTRRLTNQFAIFGKELPSNVKAFRDLVAGIDITTEAGQKLYGQIIATAPEFNDLQDAIADANSEVNALVQSLRDLAEQARAARGETEQPRNLAYIRSQFESNAILAAQGDTAAAEKLLTLGKDLMTLSKQYSLSSSEYARDLALIQRAATVSADVQEAGLGYTTPTLTPLVGTTGGTVVQTANAATDAKLEALRADMVIAMTAVAKYTQRTSDKLDAWDFGDRLNVHVDQDVNDVPIPVTVVP